MRMERAAAGLEQVRAELQAWRGQRRKGERIPEELWRRAAGAVRQYGLNPVSRVLRLDYYRLKRWVGRCDGQGAGRRGAVFVEVAGAAREAELACVVELEKGNGTRMRICVRETAAVDWSKLKEAFLGA